MLAIYIDPEVCKTAWGWIIPECYGIAVMVGAALTAWLLAGAVRKLAR